MRLRGPLLVVLLPLYCAAQSPSPSSSNAQRYFEEGERAISENRLDAAARAYENLTTLNPGLPEAHAKLGLIYYMQGRFAEAIPQLRLALQLKASLPNAEVLLAICQAEAGHYSDALAGLGKGFRHSPNEGMHRLIGLELLRSDAGLQRLDQAAEVALNLSHSYPNDPEVLYNVGRVFADLAYSSMKRLTVVAPASVWVRQAAGEADESEGHYELAIVEYRKVIAMEPDRPGIHFRLGRALLALGGNSGNYEEALSEFQKEYVLTRDTDSAYEIGEIYRKTGHAEKAEEYFTIVVKDQPSLEDGHIGLSRALLERNRPAEALAQLGTAIKLNATNEVSRYLRARAYRALGNISAQTQELEQYRRLHEANQERQKLAARGPLSPQGMTPQRLTPQRLDHGER